MKDEIPEGLHEAMCEFARLHPAEKCTDTEALALELHEFLEERGFHFGYPKLVERVLS